MYHVLSIKRIIGFLALYIILYTIYLTPTTFAHVLKTDGNIGAVLHIDPDDDPIAGQQSGFFFEFKDKTNKFKPENCNCTFSILRADKEIFTQPLFQNSSSPSLTSASIFFTFPEKDVYQIKVKGLPNTPDAFQQFELTYDIRVARVATPTNNPGQNQDGNSQNWFLTHIPHILAGVLVGAFLLGAIFKQTKKPLD